jgi:hypothetical protein
MPGDQIEVNPIGLALVVPTCRTHKFGVPPRRGTAASHTCMEACSTFDWAYKVVEDMHTDMAQVGMGVEVSMKVHWVLYEHHYELTLPIGEKT